MSFLSYLKKEKESLLLKKLYSEIKEYDITNREGHAAKVYWHSLFDKNFKRHEDDYMNKILNYGYTILRAYLARSIIKKGLDPRISLFHKSFHNFFALASDLMEPFRIIIDVEAFKIYEIGEVDFYKHKDILIQCFNKKILVNGKKQYLNNAIDIYVDSFVNQGEIPLIKYMYETNF